MSDQEQVKQAARQAGFARRKAAFDAAGPGRAGVLSSLLAGYRGVALAGYMPMRTEIDPLPAMAEAAAHGPVGVPVVMAQGSALKFALWEPDTEMVKGAFGAFVPKDPVWMEPEVIIVPLVAFDRHGGRLGYGGGFYDRTLEGLRARAAVLAIGYAFAGQQDDNLPLEATDQPLDLIVTEQGVIDPA